MDERAWLARYLALGVMLVGGLEWLLGRVVSRLAAAPPIEGVARTIIEALGRTGFFLLSTAFLLAVALLVISALHLGERASNRHRIDDMGLAIFLCVFAIFSLSQTLLSFMSNEGTQEWLTVTFNVLSAATLWWLTIRFVLTESSVVARIAVVLVTLAYTGWYASGFFASTGDGSFLGSPVDSLHVGELAAVLAPIGFFVAIALPNQRWTSIKRWIAPVLVALAFSAGNIADIIFDQGFSGVFSIWSVGFTLYLPFPIYAISLALYLYTVLTCFSKTKGTWSQYGGPNVGMGMLLLFFAGFYLQLTYQHVLAVMAVKLLTRIARPLD
ncbi:MAG: hypothetical protein ABIQ44_06615, partial [Chloroflexia bacterium]